MGVENTRAQSPAAQKPAHLAADSGMQEPASLAPSWLVVLQRATGYWRDAGFGVWQRSRHVWTNVVMPPLLSKEDWHCCLIPNTLKFG
jgi:hypothetical protein